MKKKEMKNNQFKRKKPNNQLEHFNDKYDSDDSMDYLLNILDSTSNDKRKRHFNEQNQNVVKNNWKMNGQNKVYKRKFNVIRKKKSKFKKRKLKNNE